jgi:protein-S-isoprenylcysteine O-methyltransferase Ste14
MYCGLIIALIGWGVVLGSLAPLVALEVKFEDVYRDYQRRVNRWRGWNSP